MNALTPEDIACLRARVMRYHCSRIGQDGVCLRLIAGPLDGLRILSEPATARCRFLGICHPTRAGLAQLIYRRNAGPEFRFDSIAWNGHRLTRVPPNPFAHETSLNPLSNPIGIMKDGPGSKC